MSDGATSNSEQKATLVIMLILQLRKFYQTGLGQVQSACCYELSSVSKLYRMCGVKVTFVGFGYQASYSSSDANLFANRISPTNEYFWVQ